MSTEPSFADLLWRSGAVREGDFTLKSGRRSSLFIDFGAVCWGADLVCLGRHFAGFLQSKNLAEVDVLFGPAYKGIVIATATSLALETNWGKSLPITFDRKTPKTYAEGGHFVGRNLEEVRTLTILDDVFTDGGTKYHTLDLLRPYENIDVKAVVVGVDREERDDSGVAYTEKFTESTGVQVHAIIKASELATSG